MNQLPGPKPKIPVMNDAIYLDLVLFVSWLPSVAVRTAKIIERLWK